MSFFNNNNNCYNNDCCNNNQVDSCCDERNNGSCCTTCPPGPQGPVGERGPRGPQGPAGRATGTSQIIGMALVTTTSVNSILTVRNPAGNAAALGITPLAGGTRPVFCTFDYYSNSVIVSDLPLICAPRSLAVKALRK